MEVPLGALLAKLNLGSSIELSVIPTMNASLFPSSIDYVPIGFISSTCSGASVGVPELSFDELPVPSELIAETL